MLTKGRLLDSLLGLRSKYFEPPLKKCFGNLTLNFEKIYDSQFSSSLKIVCYVLTLGDYIGTKKIIVIGQIIGSGKIDELLT